MINKQDLGSELLNELKMKSNCELHKNITVDEGATIYLDPEAKRLIINDNVHISKDAHIEVNRGAFVSIGENVTIGRHSTVASMCYIEIMDGVGIANYVSIRDHNHKKNSHKNIDDHISTPWVSGFDAAPIFIEYKALISDSVRISPGVRVGQNCRIGAGVYVRKNIPPNCNLVGDAKDTKIQGYFSGPLHPVDNNQYKFLFFGDSLIDRPSIVVDDPHYDLPSINEKVPVLSHETAGFYKELSKALKCKFPQYRHIFENHAVGGSNILDVSNQVSNATKKHQAWDISIICVGINDIWRKYQGRNDEAIDITTFSNEYKDNIRQLLGVSRTVICIGEPLVNLEEYSNEINNDLAMYNNSIKNLINTEFWDEDVFFIDLYNGFHRLHEVMEAYSSEETLWIDGVHLSDLGNYEAANIILDFICSSKVEKKIYRLKSFDRDKTQKFYNIRN